MTKNEMEIRHRREDILRELRSRSTLLLVVNHFGAYEILEDPIHGTYSAHANREAHMKEANKLKHAIIFIEQWWFYKRIDMLIKRNLRQW